MSWTTDRAWVCLEDMAHNGEAGFFILVKGRAVGDCQTPSLVLERVPLSQACSGTCWPKAFSNQVIQRAGILGWHKPRKSFLSLNTSVPIRYKECPSSWAKESLPGWPHHADVLPVSPGSQALLYCRGR